MLPTTAPCFEGNIRKGFMKMADGRRSRRRQNANRRVFVKSIILLILLAVLGGAIWILAKQIRDKDTPDVEAALDRPVDYTPIPDVEETPDAGDDAGATLDQPATGSKEELMVSADILAMQYDYDAAIAELDSIEGGADDSEVQAKKAEYQATKDSCVAVNPNEVTHIFYHSLVVDPEKGFGGDDSLAAGFSQWMTTVDEFNRVTEEMYKKGYVMIHLRDLIEETVDENGTVHMKEKQLMLPLGKKAFVMSMDDLSYYHSYDNKGIASRLILDEYGQVKNEYIENDGSISVGDYDYVPLLDQFVKEHPDASYRGAKATVALTGYNGVLGYRTDEVYNTRDPERLGKDQKAWLDAHPDFNFAEDIAMATKIADVMKENGWEFASHTWGHRHIAQIPLDQLQQDTERWENNVAPIVGDTDTIIFAHGEDLNDWQDYDPADPKFSYLKERGYNYFCNVDSAQYFLQIRDNYVRQGRRNIDGYRLYQDLINPDAATRKTADLFDINDVYDKRRPDVPDL